MYRTMPIKPSKWVVADDNAGLSVDAERAQQNWIDLLKQEDPDGVMSDEELRHILQSRDESFARDPRKADDIISNFRFEKANEIKPKVEPEQPSIEPQLENPVSQEEMMMGDTLEIDSTIPESAPRAASVIFSPTAKYLKKHKKKKGDKRHLKGEGPVADKANEIYHAIMRDKDTKGEPTKKEQASAAAIAWSQAKKTMKKKALFRGEEAKVLDSYRGMWGEQLVRISVQGNTIDVPRESLEFVSTEVIDPVAKLREFISYIPEDVSTREELVANIQNLKTAKTIAYRLITEGSADLSVNEEASVDAIHTACERMIGDFEDRLAFSFTDADVEYVNQQPKFEIGAEIISSAFSRDNDDWMNEVLEKQAAEAAEIDIEKLAKEDPLVLVSSLTEEVIANAAAVRSAALERVSSIAGPLDEETKNWVISTYVEKAETARRSALANMKKQMSEEVTENHRIANAVPDEGLFL